MTSIKNVVYEYMHLTMDRKTHLPCNIQSPTFEKDYQINQWLSVPYFYSLYLNRHSLRSDSYYFHTKYRIKNADYESDIPFTFNIHSTKCCGMKSIYFCDSNSLYGQEKILYDCLESFRVSMTGYSTKGRSLGFDCILTSNQEDIKSTLKDVFGFKELYSYKNYNSGNICHYLYLDLNQDYKMPELVD